MLGELIGLEHILLILTTIAGVLKAYFEAQKAKAQAVRADDEASRAGQAESMLKVAVESVEEARKENPEEGSKIILGIQKHTQTLGVDSKFAAIVKEITEGEGDVRKATVKFSKTKFREVLKKEDLDSKDKYI